MLMYTSGTTGRPKGVMLTHDNRFWQATNALSGYRGLRETDRTVTVAPMFHIGALGAQAIPLLYVGGTVAVLPSFDPEQTLATMAREGATVMFLVPAMWTALMKVPDFDRYDLSSLETGNHRRSTLSVAGAGLLPGQRSALSRGIRDDRDLSGSDPARRRSCAGEGGVDRPADVPRRNPDR